ncbi:hypothetical protein EDD29_8477 [Actinocorallia herbida]|uniref:Very-short-patch-repair endonuclease n=1 Tax=Actinocorallia herbida TaxID=58109 RepID=A0A3N1DB57_9ACTN|nr:hypothetical protein EDD29_8477 [Actinocorallia herbida]
MTQTTLFSMPGSRFAFVSLRGRGPLAERARRLGAAEPGAVLRLRTAAHLWGLAVPRRPAEAIPLDVALPDPRGAPLPSPDLTERDGRVLTTLERTVFDCARELPRYDALAVVDQALALGVGREALAGRARRARGRGTAQAVAVIRMADPGAESPGESLVRGVVIDAGFPKPSCQVPALPTGYRLDLGHPEYRSALEYDGEAFHTGRANRTRDALRHAVLAEAGWRVLPVTAEFRTAPAPLPLRLAHHPPELRLDPCPRPPQPDRHPHNPPDPPPRPPQPLLATPYRPPGAQGHGRAHGRRTPGGRDRADASPAPPGAQGLGHGPGQRPQAPPWTDGSWERGGPGTRRARDGPGGVRVGSAGPPAPQRLSPRTPPEEVTSGWGQPVHWPWVKEAVKATIKGREIDR